MTKDISLRPIRFTDINDRYKKWMNDEVVNQFMETRYQYHTLDDIRDFVYNVLIDSHSVMMAICYGSEHIGNIKLGAINWQHRYTDLSYFIGERDHWGKGFATEAVKLMVKYGFERLDLHKINGGAYEHNHASIAVLLKAGFILEAAFRENAFYKGKYVKEFFYGIIQEEWRESELLKKETVDCNDKKESLLRKY